MRTVLLIALIAAFAYYPVFGQADVAVDASAQTGLPDSISAVDTSRAGTLPVTSVEIDSLGLSSGEVLKVMGREPAAPVGWFFFLNCVLLGLLVLKFTVFRVYTRNSWRAWVNENLFFQLIREKAPVNFLLVLLENLLKVYMIAAASLITLELFQTGFRMTGLILRDVSGVLILFFAAKALATYLLGTVTDQVELFRVMNLNAVIASSNTAFLLIPLILVAAYLPPAVKPIGIYLVIIAFGAGVIFLVFRALRILLKARIPFNLQFFLYLCGLEILPYMFLVKILNEDIIN